MTTEAIVTWIALVVAGLIGFGSLFHFFWLMRDWSRATGEVIGNEARAGGGGAYSHANRWAYFAKIRFRASDGQEYVTLGDIGRRKEWPLGTLVEVAYAPDDPTKTMTLNALQRLVFSGAFVAIAAACAYALRTGAV